jgi:hypothetical protein
MFHVGKGISGQGRPHVLRKGVAKLMSPICGIGEMASLFHPNNPYSYGHGPMGKLKGELPMYPVACLEASVVSQACLSFEAVQLSLLRPFVAWDTDTIGIAPFNTFCPCALIPSLIGTAAES